MNNNNNNNNNNNTNNNVGTVLHKVPVDVKGLATPEDIVLALQNSSLMPAPSRGGDGGDEGGREREGISKESAVLVASAVKDSKDLSKRAAAAARKRASDAAKLVVEAPKRAADNLQRQA
jgi:hypothetical protein